MALALAGGLVWGVSNFGTATSREPAGRDGGTARSAVESQSGGDSLLAARYHLRNRTKRFFKRSTTQRRVRAVQPKVGGRKAVQPSKPPTPKSGGIAPAHPESRQLAARYHLRKRTKRFFDRAVG